jgi:nitrogen fixation NifU-like protein
MDDLYQEHILDHYKHPHHFGELPGADQTVRDSNASCGDLVVIALKLVGDKIVEAKFRGVGCAVSTAAASLLLDKINKEHPTIESLLAISETDMENLLGIEVTPTRKKCLLLPLRALQKLTQDKK